MSTEWSASKLKTWHRCHRKFFYEHVLNLGGGTSDIADFGTAFHRRCENRLREAMGLPPEPDIALPDPYEQARLDALWAGYEARWDDSSWRVLGAEVPFAYELAGHTITSHKGFDGLIQTTDGRVAVVEHKTTGSDASPGSSYVERLALDVQCSVYVDAAAALGYGDVDVLYDVAARPKHERKLATPVEDRTFTQGKGCKVCGGKARGTQGSGKRVVPTARLVIVAGTEVDFIDDTYEDAMWFENRRDAQDALGSGEVEGRHLGALKVRPPLSQYAIVQRVDSDCPACNGSGWEEAPRLHANQRDRDETPEEFFDRIVADVAARPDDFYTRTTVTRTEAQKERARASIIDTVKLARIAEAADLFPMNDHACFTFGSRCFYWSACNGIDDINDRNRFPLRSKT